MEAALAQLLYSLPDAAVAATDVERRFVLVSPAFAKLFGAKLTETIEEFFAALPLLVPDEVDDKPMADEMRPLARAQRGETVRDLVYLALCPDGVRRFLRFNASPRLDLNGEVAGMICFVQDVTTAHLQTRRERLIRDRLIDTINHHLRTPLSLVLGNAEVLEDMALHLPSAAQRTIDSLVRGARRLHELTQTVSSLVELTSATQLTVTSAELVEVVQFELATLRSMAGARDISIRAPRSRPVTITADIPLVRRALRALVQNAIEYAPGGSRVCVSLTRRGSRVELSVSDRGPGIPPGDMDVLCQPFATSDGTGAKRGLGLPLAQTVASAHGGTLRLSENCGGGLRATLRLPLDSVVTIKQHLTDQRAFDQLRALPPAGRQMQVG
jgi:PAS domain S-box-containing protein